MLVAALLLSILSRALAPSTNVLESSPTIIATVFALAANGNLLDLPWKYNGGNLAGGGIGEINPLETPQSPSNAISREEMLGDEDRWRRNASPSLPGEPNRDPVKFQSRQHERA
ncbi:hypothetical protein F5Y06DRAFT_304602 [Hypoxylon sp. FL0890]|nr:hypothetical protein F5Y06DRAFT_304602 [Hypoxylon sp. FL0890]